MSTPRTLLARVFFVHMVQCCACVFLFQDDDYEDDDDDTDESHNTYSQDSSTSTDHRTVSDMGSSIAGVAHKRVTMAGGEDSSERSETRKSPNEASSTDLAVMKAMSKADAALEAVKVCGSYFDVTRRSFVFFRSSCFLFRLLFSFISF